MIVERAVAFIAQHRAVLLEHGEVGPGVYVVVPVLPPQVLAVIGREVARHR